MKKILIFLGATIAGAGKANKHKEGKGGEKTRKGGGGQSKRVKLKSDLSKRRSYV